MEPGTNERKGWVSPALRAILFLQAAAAFCVGAGALIYAAVAARPANRATNPWSQIGIVGGLMVCAIGVATGIALCWLARGSRAASSPARSAVLVTESVATIVGLQTARGGFPLGYLVAVTAAAAVALAWSSPTRD